MSDTLRRSHLSLMRSVVHPAIAVGLPFAFLVTFDALFRSAILGEAVPRAAVGFPVVMLAAGMAETLSANFLLRERIAGPAARLRELVLVLAAAFVLLLALSGRPFRGEWSLESFEVLWPLFLVALQWSLTLVAHQALRPRELLLAIAERASGPGMKIALRDAGGIAGDSEAGLKRLRFMVVLFEIIVALLLAIAFAVRGANPGPSGGAPGRWWATLAIAHEAFGIFLISLVGLMRREQLLLAEGISSDSRRLARRILGSAIGLGCLLLAAIAVGGRGPVLPLSLLAALLEAILAFFERMSREPRQVRMPRQQGPPEGQEQGGDMREMLQQLAGQPSPVLDLIYKILGFVALAAVVAAGLYFIARPLLSRDTRAMLRGAHPLRNLLRKLGRVLAAAAAAPRALAAWLRAGGGRRGLAAVSGVLAAALRGGGERGRAARGPSAEERRRRRAEGARRAPAVREFLRLARWGQRRGVALRPSEGPQDYASRLAVAAPREAADLSSAAAAFEEIAYSGRRAEARERELAHLVRSIVRQR